MAAATSLTPEQRSQRARLAALTRWSREDPTAAVHKMQNGIQAKYERQVDPEGVLPDAERMRRADAARKADLAARSFRSSRTRKTA